MDVDLGGSRLAVWGVARADVRGRGEPGAGELSADAACEDLLLQDRTGRSTIGVHLSRGARADTRRHHVLGTGAPAS
ncbi:hypothetical protein [Amycolatopsis sp. MJM2582]|uniref:hypothetical protein n=1 Tax=Amycolatopsis sp. MJM2582 TaxID=1427749 RepID=UPI000AFD9FAB|nr:hypothetical protein [Amycolatopsis sp. MJM2582]